MKACRITLFIVASCISTILAVARSVPESPDLRIYVIDVEGGNATLVVSPSGESLLIDTGHIVAAARDAGRILDALNDAGVTTVDHLITTHWHLDHFGGMAEIARHLPIREFIDHGPNTQPNPKADAFLQQTYPLLYAKAKHVVAKPGDTIPMNGLTVTVVASAGQTIANSLTGAGAANTYCTDFVRPDADRTENSQSIGVQMTFGSFRAIHLGDLSGDKEFDLMCPTNRLGKVDLFVVSHHGQARANTKVLVHAIEPRAAVMNNGLRKGGGSEVMQVIYSAPRLENLWQLHFSAMSGQEYAAPGIFIANLPDIPPTEVPVAPDPSVRQHPPTPTEIHKGKAYWIKISAKPDGSFTVTNTRTRFSKVYPARKP